MGQSVEAVVAVLNEDPIWRRRFEAVYGSESKSPATRDRVGEALAAFVRSIETPESPYASYLAGDPAALDESAREGLSLFSGAARCDACHSGPALSDGLIHLVNTGLRPQSIDLDQIGDEISRHQQFRQRPNGGSGKGGFGGYGVRVPGAQTLTLWDVARTAPYFRDGSIADARCRGASTHRGTPYGGGRARRVPSPAPRPATPHPRGPPPAI